jgi:2-keto-myo-inositol isomerase
MTAPPIDRKRFGLNRIIAPSLGLADFYELASSLGISKVELRNDIGREDPVDGLSAGEAARLAADRGVEVISINALQKFNVAAHRPTATAELKALLELAVALGCRAVVMCPNNDPADARSPAQRLAETIDSLAAFGTLFEAAGVLGYVEPLGFGISSLASHLVAQEAIEKSGRSCYRLVHDTFHHHIGPDDREVLGRAYRIASIGLVHISGVEAQIATDDYRDEHRILVGPADTMKSREQMASLDGLGYRGDFSFEVFSPAIQALGRAELASALQASLDYVNAAPRARSS